MLLDHTILNPMGSFPSVEHNHPLGIPGAIPKGIHEQLGNRNEEDSEKRSKKMTRLLICCKYLREFMMIL
jgi:hypothetical protein